MEQRSIALTVAYNGSAFSGFARQGGDVPTVQGHLESALTTALRRPIEIVGAGRTDAGVHALGQVVSFIGDGGEPDRAELARSVDALAGPDIAVRAVRWAPPGFSARFDAIAREYRYRLVSERARPIFLRDVAWRVSAGLDLDAMRDGASHLVGEHDFRSFCVAESAEGKRTVRRVDAIEIAQGVELGEECVIVRVIGNAFLHSMVRAIVGTLVDVGVGRRTPEWVADALAARSRSAAGQTAPAHGLTFWRVTYPEGLLSPPNGEE